MALIDLCKEYFPNLEWKQRHNDEDVQCCSAIAHGLEIQIVSMPMGSTCFIQTWRTVLWRSPNRDGVSIDFALTCAREFMDDMAKAWEG